MPLLQKQKKSLNKIHKKLLNTKDDTQKFESKDTG